MSVEVTTLKSGINVVTDTMPHLETASLGVWVGSGSRDERADEHGISHLLEHMAFKGTRRRSARQIAEEIEAVGGDLNAATSAETTAYYARVLKADVPLALDVLSDILSDPTFDREELTREQNVIVQEIGAVADTPDDLIFEHLQGHRLSRTSRSAARSSAPPRRCGRSTTASCATISGGTIARPTSWWPPPARSITRRWSPRSRSVSRASTGPASPLPRAGEIRRRQPRREARARTGAYRAGAARRRGDR